MKNIIVTGGAGYIGSHVCKELYNAGYNPVTFDNLSTGNSHAVKWGELERGDILDTKKLIEIIKKYKADAIIHMAAYIDVGESVRDPGKYYTNNVNGGLSILKAMAATNLDKIVFSSTAAVYGNPKKLPLTEDTATTPINPYGNSKLMVENMLADFYVSNKIKSAILRYFNVAGADMDAEIGCEHAKPNNLIPILMNVQSGITDHIKIFGTDYNTEDGTAIRDYIHVTDLAQAHILALEYIENNQNITVNLGTGKGHSVQEVIDSVQKTTNKKVNAVNGPRREGDPEILYANSDKAQKILNWKPKYTNLDDITKSAWNWQLKLNAKKC